MAGSWSAAWSTRICSALHPALHRRVGRELLEGVADHPGLVHVHGPGPQSVRDRGALTRRPIFGVNSVGIRLAAGKQPGELEVAFGFGWPQPVPGLQPSLHRRCTCVGGDVASVGVGDQSHHHRLRLGDERVRGVQRGHGLGVVVAPQLGRAQLVELARHRRQHRRNRAGDRRFESFTHSLRLDAAADILGSVKCPRALIHKEFMNCLTSVATATGLRHDPRADAGALVDVQITLKGSCEARGYVLTCSRRRRVRRERSLLPGNHRSSDTAASDAGLVEVGVSPARTIL